MPVKRIQCADPHCDAIIAHQISDETFGLKRTDQMVTMTGNHWTSMATCPKNPAHQTSIVVTDGKVDTSVLHDKEDDDGRPANKDDG